MPAAIHPPDRSFSRRFTLAWSSRKDPRAGRACDRRRWPWQAWRSPAIAAALVLALALLGVRTGEPQTRPAVPFRLAQATPGQAPAATDFVQGDYWALIVGIDEYPGLPPGKQVLAAKAGAEAMERVLRNRYGLAREQVKRLLDGQASRGGILKQLRAYVRDIQPNDSLLIYFAGHCQGETTSKEVWWLPVDATEDDPTSYILLDDMQKILAQIPARHIFLVADSCISETLLGASKISGTPTVRDAYQKKSRWVLSSSDLFPKPEGDPRRAAPSAFSGAVIKALRDNQDAYTTPLHIAEVLMKQLPPPAAQAIKNQPLAGVGDDGGQFVFRLEGATITAGAIGRKVPVPAEDMRLASLQQQIEATRGLSLPQNIKDQAMAALQTQLDAVQKEIEAKKAEARRREEQRLAELRRQQEQERQARERQAGQATETARERAAEQARIEAARQQEDARLVALKKEAEEAARQAELKRQQEEARLAALRQQEEARLVALRKEAEEAARQAELRRQQEEARLAALKKEADEAARQAELRRQEEAKRLAALQQQQGTTQQAEAQRQAEQARQAELKRQQEEQARQAEIKRQEEEAAKRLAAERERLVAMQRQTEEAGRQAEIKRKEEEARLAALRKEAEEGARLAVLKRQEEEQRLAALRKQEEERLAQLRAQQQAAPAPPAQTVVARVPTPAIPRPPAVGPRPEDLPPMVLIPAGEFLMGSGPREGNPDETPQRKIFLDAFSIDKYATTVGRYAKFLEATGGDPPEYWNMANPAADADLPVIGVDWDQAQAYCTWAGKRLPTEAEWEKAARGADGRKHPWGNESFTPQLANVGRGGTFGYAKSLERVGSYEAGKSPYGVYEMIGNVWQWVADWYDRNYYQNAPDKNPKGPGRGEFKVIRGGSWAKVPLVLRAPARHRAAPTSQTTSIGFRCAKDGP